MSCPYPLVIFDCDGVLLDTGDAEAEVVLSLLAEQGHVSDLPSVKAIFQGRTNEAIWDALATKGVSITDDFKRRHIEGSYRAYAGTATATDGVEDVLRQLRASGVPVCVASNGPHAQMDITLAVTGLIHYFAGAVFSSDDVARGKPAPDLFLHAAASMHCRAVECAVIEDSPSGVAAGIDAGMRVYQFIGGGVRAVAHPQVTQFKSMRQLPGLLGL